MWCFESTWAWKYCWLQVKFDVYDNKVCQDVLRDMCKENF